ncbi:MAG: magnesium-translocating P-type ATPase, partial [Pirellulales bacterium]
AVIILSIILVSAVLGFWQERRADRAVERLLAMVRTTATVLRDGQAVDVPRDRIVPGDVVILSAGSAIPGDCRLLAAQDLHVDEAPLTGESYPTEKQPGVTDAIAGLGRRTNSLFLGSHVVSGQGRALVVAVGEQTIFGQLSQRLKRHPPETEFERGVRHFGYLLLEVTLLLVIAIFAINVFLDRPMLDAFMFSLALAVGLTPQLLPAIIAINLAQGAHRMAHRQVIVKHLPSIENFGSMDVLCTDKTGTLTEGVVRVQQAVDIAGRPSDSVLELAQLNAALETGFANPIDQAIRQHRPVDLSACEKLDEVPYDFMRKRLTVLVRQRHQLLMITKGAVTNTLDTCTHAARPDGSLVEMATTRPDLEAAFHAYSRQGYRTLGVAFRRLDQPLDITRHDEREMIFAGFVLLHDPLKPEVGQTVSEMVALGVRLKIISGDNRYVAAHVAEQAGLARHTPLTGPELRQLSERALQQTVERTDVFAKIEPDQKERLIHALQRNGHVVGYMGDGINDASALHVADVGVSVDSAVDVAKEAASVVLLEHDLNVLLEGIRGGRTTFANTLKYVFMASSANFGNMFSMAGASLFLPFLPLLPKQILLLNLLTDLPEMTIATDRVDPEAVSQPRRWDIRFIRRFMIVFGLISSVFDFLTFAALLLILRADEALFRTGWFTESIISACLIVLVVRSRRPFFRSRPSRMLLLAT